MVVVLRFTRMAGAVLALALVTNCSSPPATAVVDSAPRPAPTDPQHQGLTEPHGDHSPHRGGMVLMNGDIHYEVVLSTSGAHRIWFTDPVRADLPASVATGVTMTISRPGLADEVLPLAIDDSGESWIASGRPVSEPEAYVKIAYSLQGEPHEVEIPFVPAGRATP